MIIAILPISFSFSYIFFTVSDLNADTATFSGESDSFLTFDLSDYNNPLHDTIVLSFRTFQMDAILFYAYDHLSNFIMMELQKGRAIVLTFNILHSIVSGALTVSGTLAFGVVFLSLLFLLHFYNASVVVTIGLILFSAN